MEQINEVPGKEITIVKSHELRTKFSGTHLRTRRQPEGATCILWPMLQNRVKMLARLGPIPILTNTNR